MKRIKFLLALLMVMLGMAVQAQQVVINKSDGSVEVFQPNEVNSLTYKPAVKYYYYTGDGKIGTGKTITGTDDDLPTGMATAKLGTNVSSNPRTT